MTAQEAMDAGIEAQVPMPSVMTEETVEIGTGVDATAHTTGERTAGIEAQITQEQPSTNEGRQGIEALTTQEKDTGIEMTPGIEALITQEEGAWIEMIQGIEALNINIITDPALRPQKETTVAQMEKQTESNLTLPQRESTPELLSSQTATKRSEDQLRLGNRSNSEIRIIRSPGSKRGQGMTQTRARTKQKTRNVMGY